MKDILKPITGLREIAARWQAEQKRKQKVEGERAVGRTVGKVLNHEPLKSKQTMISLFEKAGLQHGTAELRKRWKITENQTQ